LKKLPKILFSVKKIEINGQEIIDILNISPSPKIGWILETLLGIVLDNPQKNNKEFLIDKTKNFYLATRNKILELFKNEFAKKILIVIFILITLMISIFLVIKNKK